MALADTPEIALEDWGTKPWFQVLCLITVISVAGLVVLGGIVRVTESGLGCPDWPLCHGGFLPPMELKPVIEYSHRLVASALVGPLVLATFIGAWLMHRREPWLVVPASVALVLLIVQALLGAVTVVQELPPAIVMAHLAVAQALLATLIIVLIVSVMGPLGKGPGPEGPSVSPKDSGHVSRRVSRKFPPVMLAAAVMTYFLLMTGSYVTASGATAACVGWPLCNGNVLPQGLAQMIHMGHRYATLVLGLFILYAIHLGIRSERGGGIRWLGIAAAAVLAAQVGAGAATTMMGFTPELRALHLSLATGVWGAVCALAVAAYARGNSPGVTVANG